MGWIGKIGKGFAARPVAMGNRGGVIVRPACKMQNERKHMLGDGGGGVSRYIANGDAARTCCYSIDVVVAGGEKTDIPQVRAGIHDLRCDIRLVADDSVAIRNGIGKLFLRKCIKKANFPQRLNGRERNVARCDGASIQNGYFHVDGFLSIGISCFIHAFFFLIIAYYPSTLCQVLMRKMYPLSYSKSKSQIPVWNQYSRSDIFLNKREALLTPI